MKELEKKLKESELNIIKSRQTWQDLTKLLIENKLNSIKDSLDLDLHVEINDSTINHESIILAFNKVPSGLSYNPQDLFNIQEKKSGIIIKSDGYLAFSQIYNGNIIVWMAYPEVEEVIRQDQIYKNLDTFPVKEINEEKIEKLVKEFLQELINWNTRNNERIPLGFKFSK